jgi:hypothetical protein
MLSQHPQCCHMFVSLGFYDGWLVGRFGNVAHLHRSEWPPFHCCCVGDSCPSTVAWGAVRMVFGSGGGNSEGPIFGLCAGDEEEGLLMLSCWRVIDR